MSTYSVKMIVSDIETLVTDFVIARLTVSTSNIERAIQRKNWAEVLAANGKNFGSKLGVIYEIDSYNKVGTGYALLGHEGSEDGNIKEKCQFIIEWEKI
ncbi:hypothetical protein [Acinetobacter calcoaceticus]|uniref:hypothetical protein n=1 Tax=Acinetobacter calcoaceticus TaxID=471 RepID=UPI00124D1366|nr:hypothetical protein [Acinetobacter calcoaceticus]